MTWMILTRFPRIPRKPPRPFMTVFADVFFFPPAPPPLPSVDDPNLLFFPFRLILRVEFSLGTVNLGRIPVFQPNGLFHEKLRIG